MVQRITASYIHLGDRSANENQEVVYVEGSFDFWGPGLAIVLKRLHPKR